MTDVIKRGNWPQNQPHTEGRWCEKTQGEGRVKAEHCCNASTSQGRPETGSTPPGRSWRKDLEGILTAPQQEEAGGKAWNGFSPTTLVRNQHCQHRLQTSALQSYETISALFEAAQFVVPIQKCPHLGFDLGSNTEEAKFCLQPGG